MNVELMNADAVRRTGPAGQIGPNAVTRLAEAVRAKLGEDACVALFRAAELERHLTSPPEHMVDERDVSALQRALFERFGEERAGELARDAGKRTGDYLLANRIPRPAQTLVRALPRSLGARALVRAIGRHAWTFAGSGTFTSSWERGRLILRLERAPVARWLRTKEPACHYYAGTFERVFGSMLGDVHVRERECEANGGTACVFEVL
jgi:divinyl protochlorophyllide a 8-vinyl-reductase